MLAKGENSIKADPKKPGDLVQKWIDQSIRSTRTYAKKDALKKQLEKLSSEVEECVKYWQNEVKTRRINSEDDFKAMVFLFEDKKKSFDEQCAKTMKFLGEMDDLIKRGPERLRSEYEGLVDMANDHRDALVSKAKYKFTESFSEKKEEFSIWESDAISPKLQAQAKKISQDCGKLLQQQKLYLDAISAVKKKLKAAYAVTQNEDKALLKLVSDLDARVDAYKKAIEAARDLLSSKLKRAEAGVKKGVRAFQFGAADRKGREKEVVAYFDKLRVGSTGVQNLTSSCEVLIEKKLDPGRKRIDSWLDRSEKAFAASRGAGSAAKSAFDAVKNKIGQLDKFVDGEKRRIKLMQAKLSQLEKLIQDKEDELFAQIREMA